MPILCLCLLTGAYALEWFPHVPGRPVLCGLALLASIMLVSRLAPRTGCLLLGFSVMGFAATAQLEDRLDRSLQSETIDVFVSISDFPVSRNGIVNLVVSPAMPDVLPTRIRLSWREPGVVPQLGETWRLVARVRRPSGYANPGGFDFAGLLFQRKIGATGYVLADAHNYRVHGAPATRVENFRRRVADRMSSALPRDAATAVLLAVVVGARHEITREQWDAYADSGTSHLMAISGLHIGLAAGAVFILVRGAMALVSFRRNCRDPALIAALIAAFCYAAMSGFAVPARRACIMLLLGGIVLLQRREILPSVLLGTTAGIVLLTDPLSILTPGFKMSFAAVAVIFMAARQHLVLRVRRPMGKPCAGFLRLGYVQMALLAGLMPLTVGLFDRFTLLAPLVNVAVLPIFNFVTVPVSIAGALLGGVFAPAGDRLLVIAHGSVELVLAVISFANQLKSLSFSTPGPVSVITLALPLLHVFLPSGWPGRRLTLLAALTIVVSRFDPPPEGCFRYDVLDVGQGLAVVVRTHTRVLLFDTGPAFQSGNNTAELVIRPFLRYRGIDRLDAVVISHSDLDHSGGIRSLLATGAVGRVLGGEELPSLGNALVPCEAGQRWRWDEIEFLVTHPGNRLAWQGNNLSCVLEVAAGNRRLLLTGDIEAPVEVLLQYRRALRRAHAVVVPHHGSGTSSSAALVDETAPEIAIVSAGRMNRWGLPKPAVVDRWHAAGAQFINTAEAGAVSQLLCHERPPEPPETARSARRKYWHEGPSDQA